MLTFARSPRLGGNLLRTEEPRHSRLAVPETGTGAEGKYVWSKETFTDLLSYINGEEIGWSYGVLKDSARAALE